MTAKLRIAGQPKKKKRATKAGLPPGALVHVGEKKVEEVAIRLWQFDAEHCTELNVTDQKTPERHGEGVWWIEVTGLHEPQLIEALCLRFRLHPLLIEDVLNTDHRPKVEEYENALFIVLKLFTYNEKEKTLDAEQVSIVLGDGFVLSFQERPGDPFEPTRDRLRTGKGKLRQRGADYLAHRLIDAIVDSYYAVIESIGMEVEDLEVAMIDTLSGETVQHAYRLKRELLKLRRFIWPLRDIVGRIERSEAEFLNEETMPYFRDVHDHIMQVGDALDMFRDILSGQLDAHLSNASTRMNEVMKTLTVIATIFIPLTFITGIYGMNFRFMPELGWVHGYFLALGSMAVVAVGMVLYFKRRGWF
jgi:magnesium transporter